MKFIRATIRRAVLALVIASPMAYFPSASAVVIPNPVPGDFGPDIGGTPPYRGKFVPDNLVVSVEAVDLGPLAPVPPGPFEGSEFGFFFNSDSGTLIKIFDKSEQNPDPNGPGSAPPRAFIDFVAGTIVDPVGPGPADDVLKSVFTPKNDKIGFYLIPDPDLQALLGVPIGTIYSTPGLNPGDEDLVGIFPALNFDKTYLMGFGQEGNIAFPYAYLALVGVTPVPEPGTLFLLLLAAFGVLTTATRRRPDNRALLTTCRT